MRLPRLALVLLLVLFPDAVSAAVVRVDVRRRDDAGTHERVIARVHFAVDPKRPANRAIADIDAAPVNTDGLVEFSGDLLMFVAKATSRSRGTVFVEVVNRGRDQSLALMSDASQGGPAPEAWDLGDRFLLEQGFTVAFLGWQFDVPPSQGLTFSAPLARVDGVVRETAIVPSRIEGGLAFRLAYCAAPAMRQAAALTYRVRLDAEPMRLAGSRWTFDAGGCAVRVTGTVEPGLYEAVYSAEGSPVAGLGLAAVRDFAAYLKHVPADSPLRAPGTATPRVIGYGYSQSGRFLREFVRDGFNAAEDGAAAFDGLMIASAGAGGGSFNHRFARPGEAGNSVLSILRPVDVPPFTDDELLSRARASHTVPKIVYTFSSTEYWARAGSLTHTTDDGVQDAPLADTSRLYFLAGTPHSSGPLPPGKRGTLDLRYFANFAQQRWAQRALLLALDEWVHDRIAPPPSRYPTLARRELVARATVEFPRSPSIVLPTYMPSVWRMDFGPRFRANRVISNEPPVLGAAYPVLVPQVDADGNDRGGIALPEIAVPLGTHTGWNVTEPQLPGLQYLAGLIGSFEAFPRTRAERQRTGDARRSIDERYAGRADYLGKVAAAADALVRERFMLPADVASVRQRAERMWDAIVDGSAAR